MSKPRSLASFKGSRFDGEGSASLLEDLEAQQEQEKPEEGGEQELQPAGWDGEELNLTRKFAHMAILVPYSMLGLLVVCPFFFVLILPRFVWVSKKSESDPTFLILRLGR
jgi:hypothetical protein